MANGDDELSKYAAKPRPDDELSQYAKKQSVPTGQPTGFTENLRATLGLSPRGGLREDLSQIGSGLKTIFTHPIESTKLLGQGLYGSQQEVAEKGTARMSQPGVGSKIQGGIQYLESGVPFVGPILSRAGELAESGDYSGAAGAMTPLATGLLRPKAPTIKANFQPDTWLPPAEATKPEVFPVAKSPGPYRGPLSAARAARSLKPTTPPPVPPFQGATSSASVLGSAELPKLPPNLRQPDVQMVERFKPPEQNRIVEPGSKPPDYKVTYQSVPQAELRSKVMSGDADAIREWQRRGLDLPANVGYMIEGGASPKPWRARQQ